MSDPRPERVPQPGQVWRCKAGTSWRPRYMDVRIVSTATDHVVIEWLDLSPPQQDIFGRKFFGGAFDPVSPDAE